MSATSCAWWLEGAADRESEFVGNFILYSDQRKIYRPMGYLVVYTLGLCSG